MMNKSLSDSHIAECSGFDPENTESEFVFHRNKRPRPHDHDDELSAFKMDMRVMIKELLSAQGEELKKITSTQMDLVRTNMNIDTSIAALVAKNQELEAKVIDLELQSRKDKEQIILLEDKIEDLQRSGRKTSIEIKNVPKKQRESKDDLIEYVTRLSTSTNSNIKKEDIRDIFRVQGKRDAKNNTPIIVELSSTLQKTELLQMCKAFNVRNKEKLRTKHLGFTKDEEVPIFVSEQLTPRGARLFFVARDLAKSKNYKFCWTSFGRVYIRKDENSPVILVRNETQVHNLLIQ